MRFFKPNIDKLSMKRDITGLIEALGDADRPIREEAGVALVRLGGPAVEALVAALGHKSAVVRESAATALGEGNVRAGPALAAALKDDRSPAVRGAAARAIGHLRDANCADALVTALADVPDINAIAREALVSLGTPAVEPLIAALRHETSRVRESAAEVLGEIAHPRAFKPLVEAMRDSDPVVVMHATLAVERFQRAQDGLVADLLNPTLDVRRSVVRSLDELGWEPGQDERAAAYWAAKCRWDECLRIGLPALNPLIRAILGIARPGERRDEERRGAAMTLGALGQPVVQPVLKAAGLAHAADDADALLQTLEFITDPAAAEELIAVLADNLPGQHFAARALGGLEDPRAVAALGDAVTDAGRIDEVRIEAARALAKIRDAGAVEPLLAVLRYGVHRPALESAVVEALGAIGDRRACAQVIETIFRHPRSEYGWRPWAAALRPLFDEYAGTIVDLAGYVVSTGDRKEVLAYRDEDWNAPALTFLVQPNRTALAALCSTNTPTTTNLLHQIQDSLAMKSNYPGAALEFRRDFGALKALAAEELTRRGNPPYDPAAYRDAAAWKRPKPA